jgi:CBS domain-containing protein
MGHPGKLSGVTVSHIMSSNVIFMNENDSVAFAIKMFGRCRISGAPVENNNGDYVGVISKTDLFARNVLEFMEMHGSLNDLPVGAVMSTKAPLVVEEGTTVEKASELMLANHVHRVFVTAKGRIIGVVSSYDVLKVVANPDELLGFTPEESREQCLLDIRSQLQKKSSKKADR